MEEGTIKIEIKVNNNGTDSIEIKGNASPKEVARAVLTLRQAEETLIKKCPIAKILMDCFERETISEGEADNSEPFKELLKNLLKKDKNKD
ncbi:MAG: hypothetical protein ACLR6T_07010 [Intestinibacter sp.]